MSLRNHPRPGWTADQIFACLIDPQVAPTHQSAAAVELASRLLGDLIGLDYAASVEDGPEALMSALERPEIMPSEHAVAGGLSVPQAVLIAMAGHCDISPPQPQAYATLVQAGMVPVLAAFLLPQEPQGGLLTRALQYLRLSAAPPPVTDPMTAAAVLAHLICIPQASEELVAMGMIPVIVNLMPRVWSQLDDTASSEPSDSPPSATASNVDQKDAARAEVQAWQQNSSQHMSATQRAGPLICINQLAIFKAPGLQLAVQNLVDMLAWVQRSDDAIRSSANASETSEGHLLISFVRQLGISTIRQMASTDDDGDAGPGSMARALADSGAVKVLSALQKTSTEQKWDRLVFSGGLGLAAAVNGLSRPLKQVKSSGAIDHLLLVMSLAYARLEQGTPEQLAQEAAAAEQAGAPPLPPKEDYEQALLRTAACLASLAFRCPQTQDVLLEANALPAFIQILKLSPKVSTDALDATSDAAVAVGVLCSGRAVQVAAATAAGCLPWLLTMLRSSQTGKVGKRQRYSAAQCLYRLAAPEIKGSAAVANDGTAQNAMTSVASLALDMGAAQMLVPLLGKKGTALPAAAALLRLQETSSDASRDRVVAAPGLVPKLQGLAALVAKSAVEGDGEAADLGWDGQSWEESTCDHVAQLMCIAGIAPEATSAESTTSVKLLVGMLKRFPNKAGALEAPLLSLTAHHPTTKTAAKQAWADSSAPTAEKHHLSKSLGELLR